LLREPFRVLLNFHGDFAPFLRQPSLEKILREKTSIKDIIESCGVPHTEVDLILLNDEPVDFGRTIAEASRHQRCL
jgi:hypothetical protein